MPYNVAILIVSDRASTGEREDASLPVFKEALENTRFNITATKIVSDTPEKIQRALESLIRINPQLILTSGGTGCAPRDNTPEVTARLLERLTPGVDEALRAFSATKAKYAMYSRGVSGIVGSTFIINLPGSPKAVRELMEFLLPTLEHPLKLLASQISDCANEA
jgi:molybdopterin adenylyltransferase